MSRRSTLIAVALTATAAVPLTAYATAQAASSPSAEVHACATARGVLTLPTSKGTCARGSHPVTIDQRGPRGAIGPRGPRGAAGRPGITTALVRTVAGPVHIGEASYGEHGIYPTFTTVLTMSDVPAGSYLVTGSVDLENSTANPGIDIDCSVAPANQQRIGDRIAVNTWSYTDSATPPDQSSVGGGQATGTMSGAMTLASAGDVEVRCLNWQHTSADTAAREAQLVLTPITALRTAAG